MMVRDWLARLTAFAVTVQGRSMEPSVRDGAQLHAVRAGFAAPIARGDVVVFWSPDDRHRLEFKRIIGLPGEDVFWIGGRMHVNGDPLDEPYIRPVSAPPGDDDISRCRRLRADEYFVAGDNRLHSRDSRAYGPVRRKAILAKLPEPILGSHDHA